MALAIVVLPFGLGAAYLFYFIVKKQWEKSFVVVKDQIQDIGRPSE